MQEEKVPDRRAGWISASGTLVAVLGGAATVAGLIIGFSAQYWINQVDSSLGALNKSTSDTALAVTKLVTSFEMFTRQSERDSLIRDTRLDKLELRIDRIERVPSVGVVGPHPNRVEHE